MIIYDGKKRDKRSHLQQFPMLHVTGIFTPHLVPTFMQNVYSSNKKIPSHLEHLSNEKNRGCLGYIRDETTVSSYIGIIIINHYTDP